MNLNDLMTSETTIQEPTYSGGLDFNVISAVEEEKKSAKNMAREKLTQHLKDRSDLRKAIRSGEKSSGNKDVDNKTVNTSTLADTFTDVMVSLGKDPAYMQERYGTNEGNIELINKMKGLQGGKFSGDIQNYIDGKATDLTGLVNNMFPDYIAAKTGTPTQVTTETVTTQPVKKEEANSLKGDTRSGREKMVEGASQFRWSDIGLESENRPLEKFINRGAGAYENARKTVAGLKSIGEWIMKETPEEFNKKIDEGQFYGDYEYDVNNGYKGSYKQWKANTKAQYADEYQKAINQTKEIDKNKGNLWFNTVDEDSTAFDIGGLSTDIAEQLLLDAWITNAFKRGYRGYKALRGAKNVAKGTELVTKGTELAVPGTNVANTEKVAKESKDIATKVIDWFKKGGTKQDIVKGGLEGGKSGIEYQLIGDVQNGELSDAQAYGLSAGFGTLLGTVFNVLSKGGEFVSEPKKQLQTSLSRIGGKDTNQILDWAEAGAKDGTLPSALQRTTDMAVKEAKQNVKTALNKAGEDLGNFRKSLGQSDLTVSDFSNTINKGLTDKGIGAKIVEKDGKYAIEGYPGQYGDVLNKIVDRMNSAVENVKNKYELYKAGEEVDFGTNTRLFEDLISDLKSFSIREPNAEVKQKFIEIENSLMDDLKGGMGESQWTEYKGYLDDYSKLKNKYNKVEELEGKMNNKSVIDQPKLEDGQYLSDFLNELTADGTISNNAADRRIAAIFADAFYGGPVKDTDKLIYPSVPGVMEGFMKLVVQTLRNPRSKMTGGWGKYATDYKPSAIRSALKKGGKQAETTAIGKMAEQPREE